MRELLTAIIGLIALAIVVAGATYSCTDSNRRYNELVNSCVKSGGSWISASGGYGQCIRTN